MSGFTCPYCGMIMAVNDDSHAVRFPSFEAGNGCYNHNIQRPLFYNSTIQMDFYKCPNCDEYTIFAVGIGNSVNEVSGPIRPFSSAKQYPSYIPVQIRDDYEEACAVLHLSPKASATLSRRCIQGMIRDFWGITKNRLYDEVSELQDKIPADLWLAIDSLRELGNIGAHMEKDTNLIVDIDPGEAEKLIKLIELLMKEWYINRHEREALFGDILQINEAKQAERKGES